MRIKQSNSNIVASRELIFMYVTVNCLDSLIPESVCGMASVEVLSLNGLGSADDCSNRHHTLPFLSSSLYSGNREGTVPDCLWSLQNLTLLHMAGNGLVGHIPDSQSSSTTRMSDFIASHNKLDGTVPFISSSLQHLDVSFNRLTGELTDDNCVNYSMGDSSMIAKVNHLSGRVPAGSDGVTDLNVLRGNMMSCESIPSNDVHSEGYSCGACHDVDAFPFHVYQCAVMCVMTGSSQYDAALYGMGCSVCLAMAIVMMMASRRIKRSTSHHHHPCGERLERWVKELIRYRRFFSGLLVVMLFAFLPLLLLRMVDSDHTYSTHWHIYSWIASYSFASGATMGYLILAMWGIALLATWCFVISTDEDNAMTGMDEERSSSSETRCRSWVVMNISFAANFVLTVGINALYVLSVTEASLSRSTTLLVQVSMSLFRIVSSVTVVPWLAKQVPDANRRVFFRVGLLLFNNLVVPCLAISLTSSNCFQVCLLTGQLLLASTSFFLIHHLCSGVAGATRSHRVHLCISFLHFVSIHRHFHILLVDRYALSGHCPVYP